MVPQSRVSYSKAFNNMPAHQRAHPNLAPLSNLRSSFDLSNLHADVTACLREPRKLSVPELRHRGHDGNTQVPGPTNSSDLTLVRPFQVKTFSDRQLS